MGDVAKNLILSGGIAHPFPETSARVAEILESAGVESVITDDLEPALLDLAGFDMVTFNALRTAHPAITGRFPSTCEDSGYEPSARAQAQVLAHLARGRAVLALHTAPICFDDWEDWPRVVGARWRWGTSSHPKVGPIRVSVATDSHSIVAGVESFETEDEVYGFMELQPDVRPLMLSPHGGTDHPLLWARETFGGRAVYVALGHDTRTMATGAYQRILQQSAVWLLGG